MIRFEKVSYEEYERSIRELHPESDLDLDALEKEYENIKLPSRGTSGSAGYDFYAPYPMYVEKYFDYAKLYPTGIRFVTDRDDIVLLCVPKSGLGCKFGVQLSNTIGVVDSDYCKSDNEGHIKVKMTAEEFKIINPGKAFMQGIIVPFLKTDEDICINTRNGGFGSTEYQSEVSNLDGKTERSCSYVM